MSKFAAAVAALVVVTAAVPAAPSLGVTWRAVANPKTPGVKIMTVGDGSNAQELGLEVGDTILAINGKVVRTGAEATAAVQAAKGKLTLLVLDVNGTGLVEVKADIDDAVAGFAAGKGTGAKYKNVSRSRK